MKKYRTILMAVFIMVFFAGVYTDGLFQQVDLQAQNQAKRHVLSIRKMNKNNKRLWRIVQSEDTTNTKVIVQRGDIVVWHVRGTDAFFQFPDENLFGTYTAIAKNNKNLILTVGKDAKIGPNVYSVFCSKDSSFAVGDSPPVIIVK